MIFFDVNLLVYAHREDTVNHILYKNWLLEQINSLKPFAVSHLVLSGFLRIVTHPKVFAVPTPLDIALAFAQSLYGMQNAVLVETGGRHWQIFTDLCKSSDARGNLVPDAYLAALAIENGCTFATSDRDYLRFQNLDVKIISF